MTASPEPKPIEVTQRTRFTVNAMGLIAIVGAALTVAGGLNAILNELKELRRDINAAALERWRADDMDRYSAVQERMNAELGLKNPNPRDPLIRVRTPTDK